MHPCRLALVLPVLAVLAAPLWAAQTDNRGIHAVPPPGPVAIDGSLADWDLSGETLVCYDLDDLRDVYSGRVAMMHDAEALYVAIRWKDPTPLGNSHDPHFQADKGWAGDSVQLRFKTDRISHVTAWYFAPRQEPCLLIDYGASLTEAFGGGSRKLARREGWNLDEGAAMAFAADASADGYVQEIRLPWSLITLGGRAPTGRLACGIELLWGEADWPVHRYADNLAEGKSSREFFWTGIDTWGPVLLSAKGRLQLPTPAWAVPVAGAAARGPVAIPYELPEDARVTLAIDDAQGRRVRNLIADQRRAKGANSERWDGLDDEGKPVAPGDYAFTAIRHQGIHARYLMSFASPGQPGWETPDGRGAFYGDHSAPQAVASAGDVLILGSPNAEAGKHVIGCDLDGRRRWGIANRGSRPGARTALATDGTTVWVAQEDQTTYVYRLEATTGRYAAWSAMATDADGTRRPVLDLPVSTLPGALGEGRPAVNLGGIAWRDGAIAVALARDGMIRVLDATSGAVRREVAVAAPRAVAFAADGALLTLSGASLLRIDAAGAATRLGSEDLTHGYALAVDGAGAIHVSRRGAQHDVLALSPAGAPLRTIGRAGGRPAVGAFADDGMREPAQIAIDARGRLWVVEETTNPKRTSCWSADGRLVSDLVGTTGYAAAGAIDAHDPTIGFCDDTAFRIDLATGAWRPIWSFGGSGEADDLFPALANSHARTVQRDGRTWLYTSPGFSDLGIRIALREGDGWRAVAYGGVVHHERALSKRAPFSAHAGRAFTWIDADGDARVDEAELAFGDFSPKAAWWGNLPGPDGTLIFPDIAGQRLLRLPVTGVNACGAPIYRIAAPEVAALDRPLLGKDLQMWAGGSAGRTYLNQTPLIGVGPDGRILFTYPSRHVSVHGSHTATAARAGYLIGPNTVLGTADLGGEVGDVFSLNGNLGENYLFTGDGLWIQALFKDTRGRFVVPAKAERGMSMDAITAGGESFGGHFTRTIDGRVLLTIGGTDARVLELTGLDGVRRFAGRIAYTSQQHAQAQVLAQAGSTAADTAKEHRVVRRAAPPTIDGKLDEWTTGTIAVPGGGRAWTAWDQERLYVAWRVAAPRDAMRNAGQDPLLLFKTGDAVDLMLAGGTAPEGLRLLVAPLAGTPTAVLYERTVPGTARSARVPFSSPSRTTWIDRVTRPGDVRVATAAIDGGWAVEAAVPWSRLGVTPSPGLRLRGDLGFLAADEGGTATVARRYWANQATNLVNDVPGEAEIKPEAWGAFVLE